MGSFGPRVYLVGQILPVLIQGQLTGTDSDMSQEEVIDIAIRWADATLERMQWPDGKPR